MIDSAVTVGGIQITDAADAERFTGTGSLTINGDGIEDTSTSRNRFDVAVILGDNQTWTKDATGTTDTRFESTIDLGSYQLTLNVGTDDLFNVSYGAGDVISGSGSIVKNGAGTLRFNQAGVANTFSGGFTLNAGTVTLRNDTSWGTGTATLNGGTVETLADLTLANTVSFTGNLSWEGTGGRDTTFSSDSISGADGITLSLQNTNDATSDVTWRFSGTSFEIASNFALDTDTAVWFQNSSGTQTFSGDISGNGMLRRDVAGGTTVLSGNNAFAGDLYLGAGTILVEHDNALGAALIDFRGGEIQSNAERTFTNELLFSSDTTFGGSNAMTFSGDGNMSGSRNFYVNVDTTLSGAITESGGTGRRLQKWGTSTLTLSGTDSNSATGDTRVYEGTLVLAKTGGAIAVADDAYVFSGATLQLAEDNQIADDQDVTVEAGAVFNLDGHTEAIDRLFNSGEVDFGPGGSLIVGYSVNGTFSGTFLGDASSTFVKNGTGNMVINGSDASSFSGTTTINNGLLRLDKDNDVEALGGDIAVNSGGTLQLQSDNQIADSAAVVVNAGGIFDLNNYKETVANLTGDGDVLLGNNELTINTSTTGTFSGVISESGDVFKDDSGTLTLSGANTYTGSTTVTAGTLIAASDTALGSTSGSTNVATGATLALQGGITITGESLALASTATLENLSGSNVYAGTITGTGDIQVTGGTLGLAADAAVNAVTVDGGSTLALSGNINVAATGTVSLSGTGDVGIGALHNTSGTNVFDGGSFALGADTLIASSAGKLDIGDDASGADPFNIGAFNLTLDTALGSTIQLNTELTGSGNVIKDGSGTLVYYMLGNAGHSGTTFVNDGEMQIDTVFDDNNGINGPLVIGDGTGAAQTAILRLGQAPGGSSYNLINDATDVTVNSDGLFDTRGYHELINNLTLDGGAVIGSGVLDRLDVAGDITSTSTSQTATISGLLGLNNTVDAIDVAAGSTLSIDAKISNGGFTKTGDGTLNLSGANSFTGAVNITDGIVHASSNFALGNFSGSTTTVSSGAQLQLQGGITVANEDLVLNGAGIATDGALRSVSGSNTWTGSVNVASSSRIETVADSLTVSGAISSGGGTLTVAGAGDTTFSGTVGLGALIKEGTGTLTVSNASVDSNVYSSATINNGTFALGGGNEILADTMNVTIGANGTFDVNTRTETIADLYGAGTLGLASGGALTVNELGNGGNAFTGTFDMDSGSTLTLDSGVIGSGANGVGAGGTLVVSGSGTLEITDDFVFDGTLEMSTGTLLLTNTGTTFDLGTLHITGNSIIDFTDADITTLNLGELIIDMGASVTAIGWTFDVDFWSADIWGGAARDTQAFDPTTRVTFNGYTNLETIWLTDGDEITVPEPSTYGALLIGSGLAVFLRRRRRLAPGSQLT